LTRYSLDKAIAGASANIGDLTVSPSELRAFVQGADVLYHCTAELPEALVRKIAGLADYLPRFPLRSSRVDALTYRHVYKTERISSELAFNNKISMEEGISELVRHAKK
jgi:hypothetical protein